jgi:serine/threonine-protein kinase
MFRRFAAVAAGFSGSDAVDLVDQLNTSLGGRYAIEREIGRGGMATVYLARDLKHERSVAIKVLLPELAATLGIERFLSEIKTTAKLQHPHILPLLDSGEADGMLYHVMPYVQGETLRARLERERQLPIADALRIACEVADALGAAHAHGIVHRDIKPENILLQGEHALVADFGIALAVHQAAGARMTQTGLSLGTPQYMSPEQAMGEKAIDARADIYALGAVTYEMLVGEPPFTGPSVQAIVARLLSDEPRSIVSQRKAVGEGVEAAVFRALEKLRADRFGTAHEFAQALTHPSLVSFSTLASAAAHPRSPRAARTFWRPSMLAPLAAGVLAGGLMIGGAAWTAAYRRGEDRSVSFTIDTPLRNGIHEPTYDVRISPDGGAVAFIAASDTSKLYVRTLADVQARPLSAANGVMRYAFAPDSKRVAMVSVEGKLRIVPLDGSAPVTLTTLQIGWSGVAWADNTTIVVGGQSDTDGLWVVSTTGGAPRPVFKAKPNTIHAYPFVAGDGETVFFVDTGPGFTEDDYLAIGSLKTGKFETSKLLTQGIAGIVGDRVLFTTAGGALMAVRFDRRSHQFIGEAERVIDGLTNAADLTASLSSSGTLAYERGQPTQRLVLADSTGVRTLSNDDRTLVVPHSLGAVRYSPDGRRIAVNVIENRSDTTIANVAIYDVAGQTLSPFTSRGDAIAPEWTPDGRRLVFVVWHARNGGIWWRAADGSDAATPLTQLPAGENAYTASPTPDGRGIVYCRGTQTANEIDYLGFAERAPERLVTADEGLMVYCTARVSPNGRWLAYVVGTGGQSQVFVRPFHSAGGRVQVSTDEGDFPLWSRDGSRLYYRSAGGWLVNASVRADGPSFAVTKRERVPATSGTVLYDLAPDGRRILLTQESNSHKQIIVTTNWLAQTWTRISTRH